jgi:hypothetical protein
MNKPSFCLFTMAFLSEDNEGSGAGLSRLHIQELSISAG